VLFAVLVIVTAGAFAQSQRLKSQPLILDKVRLGVGVKGSVFTPNGDCHGDTIASRFRLTKRDVITVSIERPNGEHVRWLKQERPLRAYKYFKFWWDGLDDNGKVVNTGPYKIRVRLAEHDRDLVLGGVLRVHRSKYEPGPNCKKPRRYPRKASKEADAG
jgi:hypothetical protein